MSITQYTNTDKCTAWTFSPDIATYKHDGHFVMLNHMKSVTLAMCELK